MPFAVKINVALREQNCQKIGSERVNITFDAWNYVIYDIFPIFSNFCS